ncbi:hypothetical protein SAMD00079811_40110 [Scytonema sp. HK-05]|uniref:hypothetical protein n=1 Tax=Scytonema sp. HK-05 TaxID=1137095 RepID=UPI0009363585|nr:hypothetical protein [Scytonema sp. HK-05]OKH61012.1 hypothetical protein NIES2130_00585 [Scytonema sp. HK-05]BAY46401.1 hypothetical protein SAMD00079811_40110 [Scytonema sp. HK-05]
MFLASSAKPIDNNLRDLVNEIEAQSPGLSVLAARQFRYSLCQTHVEVTIRESRQFNVLEEFIIRAGVELDSPPTADELASILGLDPVFVRSTIATLQKLQTLEVRSPITVTPEGRLFYEKGTVPQPPYSEKIYAVVDPLGEKLTFASEPFNDALVILPNLADFVTIDNTITDISSLSLEELQQSIQASGLALHVPEDGKIVISCKVIAPTKKKWETISLFLVFDALEEKLNIQLRKGKQILKSEPNWLESLQAEGKVSLQALCELLDETITFERKATLNQKNTEIEARLEKIQQKALETARLASAEQKKINLSRTVVQLRDGQIPQAFSEVLNSAQHQILIYSPWVNQAIVDEEFLHSLQKLVNRGVWILIGHGIAQQQEDEEKPIPAQVEEKLRGLKTPDGLPAIQVFWLGNSHVKEVIVDGKIHLCGVHNWLSYGGDYLPRGESVYKVTIPHQVQEAYEFLANRFKNHAGKLWEHAIQNRDTQLAVQPLCVWGALGMEEMALTTIQQNNWLELIPVWLNVVCHGLKSQKLSADSASFRTALSLLDEVSTEAAFIESLRQGWRRVMGAIATNNPQQALNLLSDEVWVQFLRLAIAQPTLNTPELFIAAQTPSQNMPKQPQKRRGKIP